MKASLIYLAVLLLTLPACKKDKPEDKKPEATAQKFSSIQSYYTPVEGGVLAASKKKPYSEKQFDEHGNLTKLIYRPYSDDPAQALEITNIFKYEGNNRVEEIAGDVRFTCTYTGSGDTLELKQYLKNELVRRSVYSYGTNKQKSVVTFYDVSTGAAIEKDTYSYNDVNLVVKIQHYILVPQEQASGSIAYSYNASGNIIKMESGNLQLTDKAEFSYSYNDKGWITESVSKYDSVSEPFKHTYTYDAEGLVIKDHYFYLGKEAVIDYVYTKR